MKDIWYVIKKETSAKIAVVIFVVFTLFWLSLFFFEQDSFYHALYGSTYGILAGFGGIVGLTIANKWGGAKSVMGKAILFFSLGLFAQFFGQVAYSFYIYVLKVELPYPSLGDIGYFGSVLLYIYAAWMLLRASGVKISKGSTSDKLISVLIPLIMLVVSYVFLLKGLVFDGSTPIATFLDLGYPLGQAVYVSIAILTYLLSRRLLGGIMRNKVLFILLALVVQYVADYSFLYLTKNDMWFVGGINDYIYLVAYFLMTLALIQLKTVSDSLKAIK